MTELINLSIDMLNYFYYLNYDLGLFYIFYQLDIYLKIYLFHIIKNIIIISYRQYSRTCRKLIISYS